MISIVNVSKELTVTGPHEYELRINSNVICTFTHNREDSLSTCLRRAAIAYDRELIKLFEVLNAPE